MAKEWQASRKEEMQGKVHLVEYDWTYTSNYQGTYRAQGGSKPFPEWTEVTPVKEGKHSSYRETESAPMTPCSLRSLGGCDSSTAQSEPLLRVIGLCSEARSMPLVVARCTCAPQRKEHPIDRHM